ncbi:MAG: hypothetical protein HW391_852 [Chloroflexi bacterium]|nr:hypothetical protein [Chloroflexota bacterium]
MTTGSQVSFRPWIAVPLVGVILIGLFYFLSPGSVEQSVVYDLLGLLVVAASLVALRGHRPAGWLPWLLMTSGQLAFVAGDILWTMYAAQGQDPFPSMADALYILGYPIMALGLTLAIRRRITGGDRAGLLDAAILATGTAVVWWAFVLGPLVTAGDPDPISFAIALAYPIGDILLIGIALGLVMTPGARSPSFRLLIGSLALTLVADLLFGLQSFEGTYIDGGWLDGVWLLAYVLFGTAAAHPTMGVVFEPRPVSVTLLGTVRLVLLAGAMLVGPLLLAFGRNEADSIVLVVAGASAVISVLVLARLSGIVQRLDRDIERRKALEQQLSFHAYHDPLTGLANRRRFMTAAAEALAAPEGLAALFVDLDDLKTINDEMGHDAGDALLSAVGHRLVASVRPGDLACRLGGDEFAVLLPDTDRLEEAEKAAARILEAIAAPLEIEAVPVRAAASIGVAIRHTGEVMGVDDLIRRADAAMYQAKARGKARSAIWTADLEAAPTRSASVRSAARGPAPAG